MTEHNIHNLFLPQNPTLADLQHYVKTLEDTRGFAQQTPVQKCLLLGEEIGELFKAVRKIQGLNIDEKSKTTPIAEELADILIYLCAIANRYSIDLESAFRQKEEVNKQRVWKTITPSSLYNILSLRNYR